MKFLFNERKEVLRIEIRRRATSTKTCAVCSEEFSSSEGEELKGIKRSDAEDSKEIEKVKDHSCSDL